MIRKTLAHWLGQASRKTVRRFHALEKFEDRIVPAVHVYQDQRFINIDGVDSTTLYTSTADTEIVSLAPGSDQNFGGVIDISIDQQDAAGIRQSLLAFNDIFGSGPGQIPIGSKINSASLRLRVNSSTNNESFVSFNRMLVPWGEDTVTWNSFPSVAGGVQFDGIEAVENPDFQLPNAVVGTGLKTLDATASLRAWAAGVNNFGWLIHQFGENGWDYDSAEFVNADTGTANDRRPRLTVDFTPPSGNGSFAFLENSVKVSEGNTGTKAVTFTVIRTAGDTGEAKVDFSLDANPGTATIASDYNFTAGQLTFANGERIKSFTVTINGDTAIEGPETVNLLLSNPTGGATVDATLGKAKLTIGDNDLLLNEVMNVNSTGSDLGYEFVEILGTPSTSLGGIGGKAVYFIAFNGDAEENPIPDVEPATLTPIGIADVVTKLDTATTGSGGLLVIRPTNFKYYTTPPSGANDYIETLLDTEPVGGVAGEGRFDNGSITFALVLSSVPLTAGTDYDSNNDGILELPSGAVLLDSVGTNDIHRPSSDRGLGESWAGVRLTQQNGYLDAYSRFNSQTSNDLAPNRIFSWYGGDLKSDLLVYQNPNESTTIGRATFNMPAGGQITPGALNIPRAISFDVTSYSVNESAGNVAVTINRLGDDTVEAKVTYTTSDSTAVAGSDYTAKSEQITFPIGVSSKTILIPITNDSEPEGFQTFTITLSGATPNQFVTGTSTTTVTIVDDDSKTITFQEEVDGYFGTRDTILQSTSGLSKDNLSTDLTVRIDQDTGTPSGPSQGLIRFDNLFGSAPNQIPVGSRIYGGQLTFNVVDGADSGTRIRFFRMLQDWDVGKSSWFDPLGTGSLTPTVLNGVTPDGVEALAVPDFEIDPASRIGSVTVNVPAEVLQSWASGAPNYGWVMASNSGNGWDFDSADAFLVNSRPKLSVIYTEPETTTAGKAGGFRFEQPTYTVNEGQTTATFTITRVGGNVGNANITYSLEGVTATAGTGGDFSAASGTFTFVDGGAITQSFTVTLLEDNASERNETFQLKLSNPTGGAQIFNSTATVTIRDNDLSSSILLNEILINPPANDQPFEYLELIGKAGVGLGNVYLVGMEGDNNTFAGNADVVFDLSALENGSNGFTVVTSDSGGHDIPAGTTHFKSFLLSTNNTNTFRNLQNDTNAFLVIYSPNATISSDVFDYDWDNNGVLELPAGAIIVDAIGINDGTTGDINYTTATLTIAGATPDAATRVVGNTSANDPAAWYFGDFVNNLGNASRYYVQQPSTASSANVPAGAVITPGAVNYTVNTVPAITSNGAGATASVNVITGNSAVTTVTFTDPDIGQPFAFTLSGPDAAKFSINPTTGALTFVAAPDVNSPTDTGADNVHNVTVTLSDGTGSDIQDLSIRVVPTVSGIVVNDASLQRSRLTKIQVNLSGPVDASIFQANGAITLTRTSGGAPTVVDVSSGLIVAPATGTVNSLTLTFANVSNAGLDFASLADGRWQLAIPALGYTSTLNGTEFRRLFGDADGNGTVDAGDFSFFPPFGLTTASPFDFNNNGDIDSGTDLAEFGNRFGITL